jgi:hypothetical protein
MKVAINTRPLDGPWGGGNRFVKTLASALQARGHEAVFELSSGTDLIVMIDPRSRNPQLSFTPADMFAHVGAHPQTIVVHRINECDERKGTKTMNFRLRLANYVADHTVFIASWLKELSVWRHDTPSSTILNGADEGIFVPRSAVRWDGNGPLKLVTHHWGAHDNKGWDVYGLVDRLMDEPLWKDRVSLTFIGNAPIGSTYKNIRFQKPLDGRQLAEALAEHHAYVTASINEPAGMHHVEGGLLGLPILYRKSGALPEYCAPYGIGFDGPGDFPAALSAMLGDYQRLREAVNAYPNTAAKMTSQYLELFETLYARREATAKARRRWRNPLAPLALQIVP